MSSTPTASRDVARGLDPRGPQFTAAVTSVVLVVVLILPTTGAIVLALVQALFFATGVLRGVQGTPTAWLFKTIVRPRLAAPTELEDPEPPRFAQGVGLVFVAVAIVGYLSGFTVLGQVAIGSALVAALLNAAFRFCLGCEMYLRLKRATA